MLASAIIPLRSPRGPGERETPFLARSRHGRRASGGRGGRWPALMGWPRGEAATARGRGSSAGRFAGRGGGRHRFRREAVTAGSRRRQRDAILLSLPAVLYSAPRLALQLISQALRVEARKMRVTPWPGEFESHPASLRAVRVTPSQGLRPHMHTSGNGGSESVSNSRHPACDSIQRGREQAWFCLFLRYYTPSGACLLP